jgi:diguanylate cyclase (GGDEF)-like protein
MFVDKEDAEAQTLAEQIQALRARLEEREALLEELPYHDQLTRLPNRNRLQQHLKRPGDKVLLLIDMDNFGLINSVYGPEVGDYVLAQSAEIMRLNTPQNAALYRFAGDEFAIVLDGGNQTQAEALARQINSFCAQSHIYYDEIEIKVGFTMGIAQGDGLSRLLSDALAALHQAQSQGRNRYCIYSDTLDIHQMQENNLYWIPRVRQAVENEALYPWFQPIVDIATGEVARYECLARLKDERGEWVDPYIFLEAARISGILTAITKNMISKSFAYFEGTTIHFSINITDSDLQEGYLEEMLAYRLQKHRIEPARVTLEIVESMTASQASAQTAQLARLKQMGFLIAADDFGAEHSNFSRLLSIDLDFIKIDGCFVRNITQDRRSEMIVRNIALFARSIGAKSVAEFVSSPESYAMIKALGVDYAQGYYLGRPAPAINEARCA